MKYCAIIIVGIGSLLSCMAEDVLSLPESSFRLRPTTYDLSPDCDERCCILIYPPVLPYQETSLIDFLMPIDEFPENPVQYLERYPESPVQFIGGLFTSRNYGHGLLWSGEDILRYKWSLPPGRWGEWHLSIPEIRWSYPVGNSSFHPFGVAGGVSVSRGF